MKFFNIALFLFTLAVICCATATAQDDSTAKRPALPRRPSVLGKGGKTTTTTTPPPQPAEGEDGDYADEGQYQYGDEGEAEGPSSTTTTTTEAPKKIGPVIRPFRSNDDLLNSLKRRQMNAKKNKVEKPTPKSKPTHDEQDDEESDAAPPSVPAKTFKSNSALSRRKLSKPGRQDAPVDDVATAESEQPKEEARLKRPTSFSALRKRN